jgi:hypothetical protein
MANAIQQIEAALGLAKQSARNVSGYCVEQIGDAFRVYDDHHSETFSLLPAALAFAQELAADAVASLTTIDVFTEDGTLYARCNGRPDLSCEIPWPEQITGSTDSLSVAAAVTSHLGIMQDQIAAVDHDGDFIFIHIH